jgi:hypothetical protein
MHFNQRGIGADTKSSELLARGITVTRGSMAATLCHEIGHLQFHNARETKHKAVSRSTSSNTSSITTSNANNEGNTSSDSGDGGDDGGGGEDGGDDDPSDIALSSPTVYHLIVPSNFLNCVLLAGTAWLFQDSFLAAIPLIGLCALSAFPEKLQFLRGEASLKGAKFEIRGKK